MNSLWQSFTEVSGPLVLIVDVQQYIVPIAEVIGKQMAWRDETTLALFIAKQ